MKNGKTFVEKILKAPAGSLVFAEPDLVLSQDNSARIRRIFEARGGENIAHPERLVVVLDRKMTGTTDELVHDYNAIHCFMEEQGVDRFFDCDRGICHEVLATYLKNGLLVVGNDSHTCTAGAFDCLAAGLSKTETALVWKTGRMWFRVPETVKVTLKKSLPAGVYAKDLGLWILGMLKAENVLYSSLEFHGEGVHGLSIPARMTIANMAAEMGMKNAVFPPDDVLADYMGDYAVKGVWADEDAVYGREFTVDLSQVVPMAMRAGNHVEVKSVKEWGGPEVQQGLVGACGCGRLEDLRTVARILDGRRIADGFQLSVVPASREIYMQALEEGLIDVMHRAGATILGASCGPCLGSSHMLLADTRRFITTTHSNSQERLMALGVEKFVASPSVVAMTALSGRLSSEREGEEDSYPWWLLPDEPISVHEFDDHYSDGVWNYKEIDHISCSQLLAEGWDFRPEGLEGMKSRLLEGLDVTFASRVRPGDLLVGGEDFGCGKPDAGVPQALLACGIRAVIARSVNRRFFRMALAAGLPVLILPGLVSAYHTGDRLELDLEGKKLVLAGRDWPLPQLPLDEVRQFSAG